MLDVWDDVGDSYIVKVTIYRDPSTGKFPANYFRGINSEIFSLSPAIV